ncbi:cysteine desulfurase-like protein [Vibrio astriarenae]|jgi:cysteine desulfurase family protein (TIGR01976 family)
MTYSYLSFDVELARSQFPALHQRVSERPVVFFDGPGGSQVPQSVLNAMSDYLGQYNANLGGHFFSSEKTVALVSQARESAQALFNAAHSDSIVFGANMTSLTMSLSRTISRDWLPDDEIVVTALDHYSNVSSWVEAAKDRQAKVYQARVSPLTGGLDIEHLIGLISSKTKLVALTLASNTTGSLVDAKPIIEAAHKVGAKVYLDAVHLLPHQLIDVQALGCDFAACSAYKFFGPHLGVAYIAPQHVQTLEPYKVLPATDKGPGRFETGTLNFEALAGFCAAVDYLATWSLCDGDLRQRLDSSYGQIAQHEAKLSAYFLDNISSLSSVTLYGHDSPEHNLRTPTFAINIKDYSPHDVARMLGEQNICVWSGHFYAPELIRQLGTQERGGVLRVGMMHYNTLEEIAQLKRSIESL